MTFEERAKADQTEKGESDHELQTHASVAETLQAAQPHLSVDPPEIKQHAGDFCSELTNETADVDGEMCPTATESELWDAEDQEYNSQATVSLLLQFCMTDAHDLYFYGALLTYSEVPPVCCFLL